MDEANTQGRMSPWVRNALAARLPYKVHTSTAPTRESMADMLRRTMPKGEVK